VFLSFISKFPKSEHLVNLISTKKEIKKEFIKAVEKQEEKKVGRLRITSVQKMHEHSMKGVEYQVKSWMTPTEKRVVQMKNDFEKLIR
jgi:hypothetical protein